MSNTEDHNFKWYVDEMKKHYKEEIINAKDLLNTSSKFFENHVYDYSIHCLFIEFLDFQIYFKGRVDEADQQFFNEQNKSDINLLINSLPVLPFYNKNYVYHNNMFNQSYFCNSKEKIINSTTGLQKKIIEFLEKNSCFSYYFWNITFPNIFCHFISDEFCKQAKILLLALLDNEVFFSQGASSFIRHSYYFQDFLMKLFFINSQNCSDPIKCFKKSLKKSIEKLTIHQLDILETFNDKYPEKCKKFFIDEIIKKGINLWMYSPLYSPSKNLFNDSGECNLLNELDKYFEVEDNVNKFFDSIFKKVKLRITSNSIVIHNLILDSGIKHVVTFLDILIIAKIIGPTERQKPIVKKYIDEFKPGYFLKKAFIYTQCDTFLRNLDTSNDSKYPTLHKTSFDQNIVKNWNNYVDECKAHNKLPLEFISDEQQLNNFIEIHGQEMANVGVQLSYYKLEYLNNVDVFLRDKDIALIPFKANIESMKHFIQLYSIYYSTTFPFKYDNLAKEIKNIYITFYKSYFSKLLITDMTSINKKDSKFKAIKKDIIVELENNFNNIFNANDESINNIINEYSSIKTSICSKYYRINNASYNFTGQDKKSLSLYPTFLSYLTRSQLIIAYDDHPLKIEDSNISIGMDIDIDIQDFKNYNSSGIFNYIFYTIKTFIGMKDQIRLGQFFAFISEMRLLLPQFIEGSNSKYLRELLGLENNIELTRLIFFYSIRFPQFEEISDPESQNMVNMLFMLIRYSFAEIKKLMADIPGLFDFYDQIKYLMSNLGEKIEEKEDKTDLEKENEAKAESETKDKQEQGNETPD